MLLCYPHECGIEHGALWVERHQLNCAAMLNIFANAMLL